MGWVRQRQRQGAIGLGNVRASLKAERLEPRRLLATYVVDNQFDVLDPDDGLLGLGEAIQAANASPGADVITFDDRLTGGQVEYRTSVQITEELSIVGPGAKRLTLVRFVDQPTSPVLGFSAASSTGQFFLSGITFGTGSVFSVVDFGAVDVHVSDIVAIGRVDIGVRTQGGATIVNSRIGNDPTFNVNFSAGVQAGGDVTVIGSTISGFNRMGVGTNNFNSISSGNVRVINSEITDSRTGIVAVAGSVTLIDSVVARNVDGGGVYAYGDVAIVRSEIADNVSGIPTGPGSGSGAGGIRSLQGNVSIVDSSILNNVSYVRDGLGGGGGVFAKVGTVSVERSTISGNKAMQSGGGGIYAGKGAVTIVDSEISNNSTYLNLSAGGGIYSYISATIERSVLRGNSVDGYDSDGGAVWTPRLTMRSSIVVDNVVKGEDGDGGGVHAGQVLIVDSTIANNRVTGANGHGGGVSNFFGGVLSPTSIINSTISGNRVSGQGGHGGGIYVYDGALTLIGVTVVDNHVEASDAKGGGIAVGLTLFAGASKPAIALRNSIVVGNTAQGLPAEIASKFHPVTADYSLLGSTAGLTVEQIAAVNAGVGNLVGVDPLLGPLADNGGRSMTHLPLAGSPLINGGDPASAAGAGQIPQYDQRGYPYHRVDGGRIDMGAVETQATPTFADFDADFAVDGADFLAWQRGFGSVAPHGTKGNGDADNDLDVDAADLSSWREQYGATDTGPPAPPLLPLMATTGVESSVELLDAVYSAGDFTQLFVAEEAPRWPSFKRYAGRRGTF